MDPTESGTASLSGSRVVGAAAATAAATAATAGGVCHKSVATRCSADCSAVGAGATRSLSAARPAAARGSLSGAVSVTTARIPVAHTRQRRRRRSGRQLTSAAQQPVGTHAATDRHSRRPGSVKLACTLTRNGRRRLASGAVRCEEHRLCDSGSTSCTTNAAAFSSGRRLRRLALAVAMRTSSSTGRESYGGCALGVAAPSCVYELFSLAFRRCPIDELRPLCHALEPKMLRSSLSSVADLGHASRDVERFHRGIWTDFGPSAMVNHRAHRRPLVTAVGAPESASEAALGACLTNRLVLVCAVDWHRLVVEQAAALDLSLPPCTRSLWVSLTMAVVRVRAAIPLDGRRAHKLRLAAMAQANGGCDAVLPSRGRCPTIRTWSGVRNHSTITVLPSDAAISLAPSSNGGERHTPAPVRRSPTAAGCPKSVCWVAGARY